MYKHTVILYYILIVVKALVSGSLAVSHSTGNSALSNKPQRWHHVGIRIIIIRIIRVHILIIMIIVVIFIGIDHSYSYSLIIMIPCLHLWVLTFRWFSLC